MTNRFLDNLEFGLGASVVLIILFDVFQSVVVPRWTPGYLRLSPLLLDGTWAIWRRVARRLRSASRREDFLGAFAPFALVIILFGWALALICGYGLILHALRHQIQPPPHDLASACYLAGVALLTVGFGDLVPHGDLARLVVLTAAAAGLAVVALVISFLFNLLSSFQRREVLVLTLDARAGTPPSGVALLETYSRLEMLDTLPLLLQAWEGWSAEVLESHRAYPILPFFRSSHEDTSWVSALAAVLDATTLLITTIDAGPQGPARLMHGMGVHAVSDLNYWCGLRCGPEVGVTRAEWEAARLRLAAVGFPLRDAESGWSAFARLRQDYAGPLNALARHFETPPAAWVENRPANPHHSTHLDRKGEREESMSGACQHLDQVRDVTPSARGCEECLQIGDRWVHLRLCRVCGHVGCCDASKNKHATGHFHATAHPIIQSHEPGEDWGWCYVDEQVVELP